MNNEALAKSFYDAIIAASYIQDPNLRQDVMYELVQTNRNLYNPPMDMASAVTGKPNKPGTIKPTH